MNFIEKKIYIKKLTVSEKHDKSGVRTHAFSRESIEILCYADVQKPM